MLWWALQRNFAATTANTIQAAVLGEQIKSMGAQIEKLNDHFQKVNKLEYDIKIAHQRYGDLKDLVLSKNDKAQAKPNGETHSDG